MTQIAPFFSEMEDYIHDSRIKLSRGEDFDMAGLDAKIESLCDRVLDMPEKERLMYEDRLKQLLDGLNTLGLELRDKIEGIKELPTHKRAHAAYKTADSRDNFGKRDDE